MAIFLPLLAVAVFAALWWARRGSSLTRDCRWRLDRRTGPSAWRCATCGAETSADRAPRQCLRGLGD